jgi:hypothetical protein
LEPIVQKNRPGAFILHPKVLLSLSSYFKKTFGFLFVIIGFRAKFNVITKLSEDGIPLNNFKCVL